MLFDINSEDERLALEEALRLLLDQEGRGASPAIGLLLQRVEALRKDHLVIIQDPDPRPSQALTHSEAWRAAQVGHDNGCTVSVMRILAHVESGKKFPTTDDRGRDL